MKVALFNKKRSLKENNKGVALISVIIVIAFVAALASILLMTTLVNFKMKAVNTRGKDAFYSAEQVLDEVNVYLQKVVSDSMSDAYKYVMKNYADDTARGKKDKMILRYYENIWTELEVDGSGHSKYDIAKIEDHLRESTKWNTGATPGTIDEYGGILVAVDEAGVESATEGDMITYTIDGVVLKNLKIYYKDPKGFVSIIQTDIRLGAPNFDFAKSSEVPQISEFSVVGDTNVTASGVGELELGGNIYANNLVFSSGRTGGKVKINGNNKIITKYDLDMKNTNLTTKSGVELWAKNIIVNSSKVNIEGDVYVENDMDIKGKNSDVKLTGRYIGYGNGAIDRKGQGTFNDALDVSYKSSAIVINGIESKLDLTGLKKLYLGGRAYVGTSGGDITTGESIAIKSDQMMYLVPPSAIGVVQKGEKYESMFNKNPLTVAECTTLKAMMGVNTNEELVSYDMEIPELNDNKLEIYMTNPLLDRGQLVYDDNGELQYETRTLDCKPIVVRKNKSINSDEDLVYFYMDFNTEANANAYYENYYAANKERTDKFLDYYGDSIKLPPASVSSKTAGDYPYLEGLDESGKKVYSTMMGISAESNQENVNNNNRYTDMFDSLTHYLVSYRDGNHNRANSFAEDEDDRTPDPLNPSKIIVDRRLVYDNVISTENNKKFIVAGGKTQLEALALMGTHVSGNEYYFENDNEYDGNVKKVTARTTDGGVTWVFSIPGALPGQSKKIAYISTNPDDNVSITSNDDYKLVITAGKATLSRDFAGLLIAHDEVVVKNGTTKVLSDKERVDEILKFEIGEAYYYVANVLKDGENYTSGENANFSLRDFIIYENWKKE